MSSSNSNSNSRSKESSWNIGVNLEAKIKKLAEVGAGVQAGYSQTTSYNWAKATEKTFQQSTTTEASVSALAGMVLTIEQVVGVCGEITARTEKFIFSHDFKDENVACSNLSDGHEVLVTCDASDSMVMTDS